MKWQFFIFTKLNLDGKSPKVICDHTGILSSKIYLSFLEEKSVPYLVTDKVIEMISASGENPELVILTNLKVVPAFITKKFTYRHFNLSDIPLNGNVASILKSFTDSEIIELMNYVFATDYSQVITPQNIGNLIISAKIHSNRIEINLLNNQINLILQDVPQSESVLEIARLWGKLVYLSVIYEDYQYLSIVEKVDNFASVFVLSGGMTSVFYSSTPKNPKTVDKILANIKTQEPHKIALICFDCMGYAEWNLLKEYLTKVNFNFTDFALFTMLPSVTSISRTAIFHGSREVYNIKSTGRSDESKAFSNFFHEKETKYFTEKDLINDDSLLGYDCISLLYPFFDDLCHSIKFPPNQTSKSLYFEAVRAYIEKSNVLQTFETLVQNGFQVYICSDHGSVVAMGNGKKFDKYLIDSFAKRAVIVPTESSDLIDYEKILIPFEDDKLIVLPGSRTMFANKDQIEINHGGITVEEMVVPFIKLIR